MNDENKNLCDYMQQFSVFFDTRANYQSLVTQSMITTMITAPLSQYLDMFSSSKKQNDTFVKYHNPAEVILGQGHKFVNW